MDKKTFIDFMSKYDFYHELRYKTKSLDENKKAKEFSLGKDVCRSLVENLVFPALKSKNDFSKESFEKYGKIRDILIDLYYNHLDMNNENFFEVFPEIKKMDEMYIENAEQWLPEYNRTFDDLDDSKIIELESFIFNNEKLLNTKNANIFIKKMQERDQVNIDNIKEKVRQECINEGKINLGKVREIIRSSYQLDYETINCQSQVVQMLLGRKLEGKEAANAVGEFRYLTDIMYDDGEIQGITSFFDPNEFRVFSKEERSNSSISVNIEEIESTEKNQNLDDIEFSEEENYNFFKIVGKSIAKYTLKLNEVIKNPIRYFRQKQQRGGSENER